jgi:hypothetical protein
VVAILFASVLDFSAELSCQRAAALHAFRADARDCLWCGRTRTHHGLTGDARRGAGRARLVGSLVGEKVEEVVEGQVSAEVNRRNVEASFRRLEAAGLRRASLTCSAYDLLAADFGGEPPLESEVAALVWDMAEALLLRRLFAPGAPAGSSWKTALLAWCHARSKPSPLPLPSLSPPSPLPLPSASASALHLCLARSALCGAAERSADACERERHAGEEGGAP